MSTGFISDVAVDATSVYVCGETGVSKLAL
jgi:hypothetical protein